MCVGVGRFLFFIMAKKKPVICRTQWVRLPYPRRFRESIIKDTGPRLKKISRYSFFVFFFDNYPQFFFCTGYLFMCVCVTGEEGVTWVKEKASARIFLCAQYLTLSLFTGRTRTSSWKSWRKMYGFGLIRELFLLEYRLDGKKILVSSRASREDSILTFTAISKGNSESASIFSRSLLANLFFRFFFYPWGNGKKYFFLQL